MNKFFSFCDILIHNYNAAQSDDFSVPFISSDTYIIYNKKIIHSYAK